MPVRIDVDSSQSSFRPGDTVSGTASWNLDQFSTLELRLVWYTQGKGTQDLGVVQTQSIQSRETNGHQYFQFVLPEGPYSFSGKLISVLWAIELVTAAGDSDRVGIVVSPTGSEVVLPQQ